MKDQAFVKTVALREVSMKEEKYKDKADILAKAREVIGIPLRRIDKTNRLSTGKGAIGSVLEESWFEYSINSDSLPDFPDAGVELKATPYVRKKNGITAKERLVCNIINYMKEYKNTFFESSFWKKCETLLIMPYEHRENVPKGEFTIDEAVLFSFPEDDLLIIQQDWKNIIEKVRAGKAHEISEGDTLYLGACTKGATAASVREQPFSDIPAKQRAYSLKQSYMTTILRSYIFGNEVNEHVIKDPDILRLEGFESYIVNKVKPYFGRTQESLVEEFKLNIQSKSINAQIIAHILGINGNITATDEFKKANIVPKTIRINKNGSIPESMSFPAFNPKELIKEEWDTSEFKNMLEQTKFLFVIFRFQENGELIFDNIKFWNIPEKDLEEVKKVWEETVKVLKEGVQFTKVGNRVLNNLPKASDDSVAHVRPHGRDASDTVELPDGRRITKQSFWLNSRYIRKQIEK